jgi:hypothetical protein
MTHALATKSSALRYSLSMVLCWRGAPVLQVRLMLPRCLAPVIVMTEDMVRHYSFSTTHHNSLSDPEKIFPSAPRETVPILSVP